MEYLIHCVLNRSSLISCKLNKFVRSMYIDPKLGFLSVSLRLYFQVFCSSQRDFGIFLLLWLDFSVFPNSGKKRWKIASFFKHKLRLYFQIIPNSLKNWEGLTVRIAFQAWDVCRRKTGGPNLRLNYQFLRKGYVYIYLYTNFVSV